MVILLITHEKHRGVVPFRRTLVPAAHAVGEDNPVVRGRIVGEIERVKAWAPQNWDKYDELIKEIRVETDSETRIDLMHQAEDMLMDTWAVVPLYEYNDMYMDKSNVSCDYANLFGMKYFMYTCLLYTSKYAGRSTAEC